MDNPLAMSDEEFLKSAVPPVVEKPAGETTVTEPVVEKTVVEPVVETPVVKEPVVETPVVETKVDDKTKKDEVVEEKPLPKEIITEDDLKKKKDVVVDPKTKTAVEPEKKADGTVVDPAKTTVETTTPPDYKVLYETIMAPLKANGKVIELKTPEEAIQLMQMGANYTKKMQAIVPHRKVLTMLENNGLLDENRISFLIDLDKKNPEAIKKLIKDAGIDPLDIDTKVAPTYLEGNHRVSDEEVQFKTAVEDLRSNSSGVETLQTINTWDQASKEVLWKNPDLMGVIHSQRENGIFAQIQTEIDRRRTLGTIPANMPFLTAYKAVGDELQAANKFVRPAAAAVVDPKGTVTTQPVVTRVATPKPQAVNSERVSAASSTRSTPRTANKFVNPLSLSDDEFMAQMAGRL